MTENSLDFDEDLEKFRPITRPDMTALFNNVDEWWIYYSA